MRALLGAFLAVILSLFICWLLVPDQFERLLGF